MATTLRLLMEWSFLVFKQIKGPFTRDAAVMMGQRCADPFTALLTNAKCNRQWSINNIRSSRDNPKEYTVNRRRVGAGSKQGSERIIQNIRSERQAAKNHE